MTCLQHIPQEFLNDIRCGDCLPVIGAGFSRNAILPPGCSMPLWDDLGPEIAKKLGSDAGRGPVRTMSEYCQRFTKFQLIRILRDLLHIRTAKPSDAHLAFARLPFRQILTTDFDFLLEHAYGRSDKPCFPVAAEPLLPFGVPDGETRILKMHGDFQQLNNMVITEDDYDSFWDQHRDMAFTVLNLLVTHSLLFIGYSVEDPDFRQIWAMVKKDFGQLRRPAYAIGVDPRDGLVEEYRRRGMTRVLHLPGKIVDHGQILTSLFGEICCCLVEPPDVA